MSSTPNIPPHTEAASLPRWVMALFVVAFALVAFLLYANYAQRQALRQAEEDAKTKNQALVAELEKTNSRVADLKGQMDVTTQKLGLTEDELARARGLAQAVRKDQQQSEVQLRQQIGAVQADTVTKFGQVTTQLSGAQTDIAATKADLEAHQGQAAEHYRRPRCPERPDRAQS